MLQPTPFPACCSCGHGHELRQAYRESALLVMIAPGSRCRCRTPPVVLRDGPFSDSHLRSYGQAASHTRNAQG